MDVLIGSLGVLVTMLVAAGMIYTTPRNLDRVIRTEDGVVTSAADHEASAKSPAA